MRLGTLILLTAGTLAAAAYVARQRLAQLLATLGPKWTNLHPDVKARAERVLEAANARFNPEGLAVGIFDGWRDQAAQQKHIDAGASWVSAASRSYHVWGLAVDFVFIDKHGRWTWLPNPAAPNDKGFRDPRWYELGRIIEAEGFEWGGRWATFDGPHAQLPVRSTATLVASYAGFDEWRQAWGAA